MGRTGYIVAGCAAAAAIVGIFLIFAPFGRSMGFKDQQPVPAETNVTQVSSEEPRLSLVLLKGSEDDAVAVKQFDSDKNETIGLRSNDHIRFESPQARTPESITALAKDIDDGRILILRKSYDVNNEFFLNLDPGKYELRVRASWFDKGTFLYVYDVTVT